VADRRAGTIERLRTCLDDARRAALRRRGGRVASYIPELGRADRELFALALCAADGHRVAVGDVESEFTLQSAAKPFVYGLALQRFGVAAVHARVGVEPTGQAFDSIVRLEPTSGRPHNPMVNAGAICVTGMFCALPHEQRLSSLQALFDALAGRPLPGVDFPTFLSEREAGDRNRAMAHLLRHGNLLDPPADEVLELYFQQCSLLATAADLAVMGATLASGGINPATGERVFSPEVVRHVLTLMATCGLYDRSGRFLFEAGLPAKSGVSGALVAVAPGGFGIAAFSPALDAKGTSVRGGVAVRRVATKLGLHVLTPRGTRAATRAHGLAAVLDRLVDETRGDDGGEPAAYLPPHPDGVGIALCSVDGDELASGDADTPFSLQAMANPLVYALVHELRGRAAVHRLVGHEPSGNPYHAIRLDRASKRPSNPLGNAGAIAVSSLVPGEDPGARLETVLGVLGRWSGARRLYVDAEVHRAELEHGERNRAIASLLRHFGLIDEVSAPLELYFQQCAVQATCRQLARIAAVLAAGGRLPGGGARMLRGRVVRDSLSLMFTCGFHDQSGRFAFDAGIPAKTGISGGILAVVPGRWGIATWSPRVNTHGTSVRGEALLTALARRMEWGLFDGIDGRPGQGCYPG
jgi:glutaminase A